MPRLKSADQIAIMQSLTQQAAGWLVGMSDRNLKRLDAPRGTDGKYNARDMCRWAANRAAKPERAEGDEMLTTDADSPALERYRLARAIKAERENEIDGGRLIDLERMSARHNAMADRLRKLGDQLGRSVSLNGRDAQQMLNDAIEELDWITADAR